MNVRTATATTFSLIVLIVGLYLLIPEIRHTLPPEMWRTLNKWFHSQYYIGVYHSFILFASAWFIVIVGIIDVILNNRVAVALLLSLNVPIILSIITIILLFFPVNVYIFWGMVYISLILGILWTFRKIISNNHREGQKLIPFIKEIKTGVGTGRNHISDRYIVFGISILLTGVYILLLVSFVIYVIVYWGMFT